MSVTALETYLGPLKEMLNREGVSEISINRPGEVWLDIRGERHKEASPELTLEHLMSLGRLVAQSTSQMISEESPLLSATLPAGYRIQVIFPPACEKGTVAMSIRRQTTLRMDLEEYEALGAFESTSIGKLVDKDVARLKSLLAGGQIKDFIKEAVLAKKNIVISGGTSTGKTTFL